MNNFSGGLGRLARPPQSPTPPSLTQPPGFILLQLKGKSGFAYQVFWSQAWSALRTSWAQKMLWRPHRISFGAPLGFKKCFGVRTESLSGHLLGSKNALASAQERFRGTSWAQKMLWRPHRIAFGTPRGFKKCFGVRTESLLRVWGIWGGLGKPGEAWGDLGRPGEAWGGLGRPGEPKHQKRDNRNKR